MNRFLLIVLACLASTYALAAEQAGDTRIAGQDVTVVVPPEETADCDPEQDAWRCAPPAMSGEPRIIEWDEEGRKAILELRLSNFEHARIEEIDALTNRLLGVVWEADSDPFSQPEPIEAGIAVSAAAGRVYRLTVRNPHNVADPLVDNLLLPGIADGIDLNLERLPVGFGIEVPDLEVLPFPGNFLCDIFADPWGCKQPTIHGLEIPAREQGWIDSRTEYPMGYVMKLGVTVENAARVVVESLNDPLYSPLTLLVHRFPLVVGPGGNGGRKTVDFQMQIYKQRHRIRIRATNKHGTTVKDEIIQINSKMSPAISRAGWVDRTYNPVSAEDSDQAVYLELNSLRFADSARLSLLSSNFRCDGSFFRDNGKSDYLLGLNRMAMRTGTTVRVPVILKNCPGNTYSVTVLVSPGQVEWFPESEKQLSGPLKVSSLVNPQPRIIATSLEVDGKDPGLPRGSYFAGARLKLFVEAVEADELVVESATNHQLAYAGGQRNNHVKGYFPLVADFRLGSGFDLVARTPNNPRSDTRRFLPKVLRQAKLTVPVVWQSQAAPTTSVANISCSVHPKGTPFTGRFDGTKTIKVNRRQSASETLVFDLEGIAVDSQKPSDTVSVSCSAVGDIPGQGLGSMSQDTKYTFGTWPVGPVAITAKPYELRMQ